MSRIRALYRPGAIGFERQNEDDSYSDFNARYEGEPQLVPCKTCNSLYCGPVACRTAETAPAEPTEAPRCRYVKGEICNCDGRWTCLDVVA